jgi:hypothetical protein
MSEGSFTESVVEDAALAWLESLGYAIKHAAGDRAGGIIHWARGSCCKKCHD